MEGRTPSIQFGRLKYYRLLEAVTGDQKIGDINEGVQDNTVSNVVIEDGKNDDLRAELRRVGMAHIEPGNRLEIRNVAIRQQIDCFILSLGVGDLESLSEEFARNGPESYNAALETVDLDALISRIRSGTVCGTPVDQLFEILSDYVNYGAIAPHDVVAARRIESPDPFFKSHLRYGQQREYRVVLIPKITVGDVDHIRVIASDGEPLFVWRPISGTTGAKLPKVGTTREDFAAIVQQCFIEWECRNRAPPIDFDRSDWEQQALKQAILEKRLFEPIARRMILGYWAIRDQHRSTSIDDAIIQSVSPMMFNSRIALFVNSLGLHLWPPN